MMRNCVVRASRLALAAFYTFRLIDLRFAVDDGNCALRTVFNTRMRHAVATLVGNVIFVIGSLVACGRYNLH